MIDDDEDTDVTVAPSEMLPPDAPHTSANERLLKAALEEARREADRQRGRAASLDQKNDHLLAANIEKDEAIAELKGVAGRQALEILRLKKELREALAKATPSPASGAPLPPSK